MMKTAHKWWLNVVFVVCLAFVLAACGGEGESEPASGTENESANEAEDANENEGANENENANENEDTNEAENENAGEATGGDAEHNFTIGVITEPSHMWAQAAEVFAEELETNSDGRMTLEVYPSGQLGNESDMLQQIESGSLDFGFITNAELTSREDVFAAWFAPYLFETIEEAHEARQSDVAIEMFNTLEQYNMVGLDYFFAGQRVMLFGEEEVQGPEDMEGMVLRVTPSPTLLEFYHSTGASTEAIPLPEVYTAVQTGVIDGMDMDLDATITNNFYEVVDYGAVTNHMVWPAIAIVNKDTFESLSEEDQQIIRDGVEVAADYSAETRSALEEEFKEQLRDEGMTIYELDQSVFEEQIQNFDETFKPEHELIEEFIDTFRE